MPHALIFVNGDINDGEMVRRTLHHAQNPLVVAVDGGARVAQYFNLRIDVLVGDMDSLDADEFQAIVNAGAEVRRHPAEKDFTDLELALMFITKRHYEWIRIIGGIGGRIDQTLANIYLLALPQLAGCDVRMVASNQEIYLLNAGSHTIHGKQDDTISLLPLGGSVSGIRTDNLYYPLKDETLNFGPARGVSNVMTADTATISLQSGVLMLVHTIGRA